MIFGITLMAVLGVSSITPAFPEIIKYFGISEEQVGLLITVFTLPGIALTPFLGIMADRWGRKRILVPSLLLFGLAGPACFFAEGFTGLLILRFLQGTGAAALGSLNMTLIGDLFSGRDRIAAMGYNASILSVGTASYPVIGGALALLGWNYPFLMPVLALPLSALVLFNLDNPEPEGAYVWKTYLKNMAHGLIKRNVLLIFLITMLTFIILYGALLTYFPLLMDIRFGANSFVIGLLLFSQSLTTALTSANVRRINKYLSQITMIRIAFLLYLLALIVLPLITNNLIFLVFPMVLFGTAMGMNMPTIQSMLAGFASFEHRGAFMSINGMVLRIGQTMGPLVIGLFYTWKGLNAAFFAGSATALIMLVILSIFWKK